MLLTILLARAHPYGHAPSGAAGGPAIVGQRIELTVDPGAVGLRYVAEVPFVRLLQEGEAAAAAEGLVGASRDGLRVQWDGAPVAVEWADARATPGATGFYDLTLTGTIPLPSETGTLRIRNGNFPDEPNFFATSVKVSGDLVVTASSLARVKDGRVRDNRHGAWLKDEEAREPWFTIRPARPWERRGEPAALPERLEGLAVLDPPVGWIVAAAAAGVGTVGVAAWAWGRARRRVLVASADG